MAVRLVAAGAVIAGAAVVAPGGRPAQAAPTNDPTCGTQVNGTPAGPSGQPANSYALNVGGASEFGTVWDPPSNTQVAFPHLIAADTTGANGTAVRRLAGRFGLNPDSVSAPARGGQVVSVDGGATFPAGTYTEDQAVAPPVVGATRLRNGTLLGYSFKPSATSGSTATYSAYRSTDDGVSWTAQTSTFGLGATANGSRLTGQPLELADGTILVVLYGTFTDGTNDRAQLQASTDGGRTFTRRAILANGNATNDYNEGSIAALPSGKLIAVIRHHVSEALATPVYVTSTNNGATWTSPQALSVSFPNGYDPYNDTSKALLAVAPDLKLMPNGVLVLRSGRPDNWVAISTNGEGTGWVGQLTYRNCPSDGVRTHGSTGYGGIEYLSANRAIVIGDNCELTWGCVTAAETDFTVDKQTRAWRRWIDVLTPDVGRIDLATKYRTGTITVGGTMTTPVTGHPRARADGAFDGSTEYWSSAVDADSAGTFVLNLDRAYPLTKVGLSLRNGRAASGRVYASTDGVNWGQPIATATNRTHLAMEYFPQTTPVSARYVKVELDATTGCDSGLGSSCAFLNELELYSSINSFENDPVNNRPRGYTNIVQSWATQRSGDLAGNDSASALRIVDTNPDAHSQVTWNGTAAASKTLEFRLKPVSLLGFLFPVLGRNSAGSTVNAYHLAVAADGSIRRYNGSQWIALTAAGVVAEGRWHTIRVTATTSAATIALNGVTVASNVPVTAAATTLTGYTFASNGTGTSGDDYLVDDVFMS
ncbi:exo-alpha-sialidase [Plantactinospora sp. S1510]|uniref:Exo-alpha-sialidase n=1 Tax=Plantactinospora alkalitolerans TaxID=2789879 RepID=A0ABS0GUJ2_9ACTN|nr:exo-alpha-sialidase [Plantactinospora alkalitolerans]MBF9129653.1 exo-alpha-sialidase [Plantactinospora alkalitolerans]